MKQINKFIIVAIGGMIINSSCSKKLDVFPVDQTTSTNVYNTKDGYKQVLSKVYSAYAVTGSDGPGSSDIAGIDAGFSDFFRLYWKAQELSTDEAVVAWGDAGIQDFHLMNWSSENPFTKGLYYRCLYQITLANEFLRQSTDAKLAANGIVGADAEEIRKFRLEARFLRAYQYANLMDIYGNPPFSTDADPLGTTPKQIERKDLFRYVVNELIAIEPNMYPAKTNEYGRADRAATEALLARTFLNAEVYSGTPKYDSAALYAKKVIDAGYSLIGDYTQLMLADNNINNTESILTINYDGKRTQTYGGTTFLTHASVGGSMTSAEYGIGSGWGGIRTTKNIKNLYVDLVFNSDKRAQFYTNGQNTEISDLTKFTDGLAVTKYRNKTKAGASGSDETFVDSDMPIFRLAEMYLIYGEAVARSSAAGDANLAMLYMNNLRTRAYGTTSGNVTLADATNPDFYLDERARELFWEGFRRTDLIRFNKFTSSAYLWPWKGGSKDGASVAAFRNIYPLPLSDIAANPKLKQNTGY
jgi:starch-binding outer membrane protein, SusD/RagB family